MATFQTLKKWGGKKGFGVSKGIGETKASLIKKLVKVMKDNQDDLTEDQLEWLSEQLGEELGKPKTKKKKKEKAEPKAKEKKKKKKKKEPEPEEEEEEEEEEEVEEKKPKRKKKKKKEPEEEAVLVEAGPRALRGYAKELDIKVKGWKKWEAHEWEELANKVYAEVDDMDDEEREELSKDLFTFYTIIKKQQDEAPEEEPSEIELPKKTELKRWAGIVEVKHKGREPEEVAQELLDEFGEMDDDDKTDLPDSFIEWASIQLGLDVPEKAELPDGPLPEYKTLKTFAKEVGFGIKDIKKADKHPPTIVEMIVEAYDEDDEDEYSEELIAFVASMAPAEVGEEEEEEESTDELVAMLVEAGYEESDIEEWSRAQLIAKLVEDYKDEDDRDDLPEEAIEFLREEKPELFEKKKAAKKKKKKKKK
jgi:hypothetical protein